MSDEVRVNGNLHSWGSIIFKIDDVKYHGFTSINYGDARERTKGHGMGRHGAARGRSRGKYTTEPVTVSAFKGTMQQVRKALADAGDGESFGDVEFQILVQYIESDDTEITVEIDRCVWVKDSSKNEEGADSLQDEAEFDCMLIRRNGLTLFDNSQPSI